jgi:hypothetical protein
MATHNSSTLLNYKAPTSAPAGYIFDGYWSTPGGIIGSMVINKDNTYEANVLGFTNENRQWTRDATSTTLYARWTITYTVTFNGNGNTSGNGTVPPKITWSNGQSVTLPLQGNLLKTNYSFSEWNTKDDSTGTNYKAGSIQKLGNANLTLYAKWTQAVTLNPQGGSGGSANFTATYNSSSLLNYKAPTSAPAGYTISDFDGYWTTAAGSVGSRVISKVGGYERSVSGFTNFEAQWTRNDTPLILYARWISNNKYTLTDKFLFASITPSGAILTPNAIYEGTLTVEKGYTLPDSILVKRGTTELEEKKQYNYNKDTGKITIYANQVTDNITISGLAPYKSTLLGGKNLYIIKTPASNIALKLCGNNENLTGPSPLMPQYRSTKATGDYGINGGWFEKEYLLNIAINNGKFLSPETVNIKKDKDGNEKAYRRDGSRQTVGKGVLCYSNNKVFYIELEKQDDDTGYFIDDTTSYQWAQGGIGLHLTENKASWEELVGYNGEYGIEKKSPEIAEPHVGRNALVADSTTKDVYLIVYCEEWTYVGGAAGDRIKLQKFRDAIIEYLKNEVSDDLTRFIGVFPDGGSSTQIVYGGTSLKTTSRSLQQIITLNTK